MAFFKDNLAKPAPERYIIVDFTGTRYDGVAVALGGPYTNHLHLAPDREHASTSPLVFYRPDALPSAQPAASKQ